MSDPERSREPVPDRRTCCGATPAALSRRRAVCGGNLTKCIGKSAVIGGDSVFRSGAPEGIRTTDGYSAAIRMRAGGRENRNNCVERRPMQARFEGAVLRLSCVNRDRASCRSSHVRNAPLSTVGPKKAACRDGPKATKCTAAKPCSMTSSSRPSNVIGMVRPSATHVHFIPRRN
jgi:hypothetical protein